MEYNNNFAYDLKVGQVKENELGEALENKTIEVKTDMGQAQRTGNFFIEYESRGKASGIAKTQADYWALSIGPAIVMVKTEDLKKMCRKYINTFRDKRGGDSNTSKGILLPITDLYKIIEQPTGDRTI